MTSFRNIRFVLAILVMAVVIGLLAAIFHKGSKSPVISDPISQKFPNNIDVALQNAQFTEVREGTLVWQLFAERTEYDKTGEIAYLTGIKMKFPKTRFGLITLTAVKGEYSTKSRDVKLREKVHVVAGDGVRFYTESIDYLSSRSCFKTKAPVRFRQQRLSLVARGMSLDLNDQKVRFITDIDAVVEGTGIP